MTTWNRAWTHPSVTAFCGKADPVVTMISRARAAVLESKDKGWSGPPFDPLLLAEQMGICVVPREGIADARTIPGKGLKVSIEYNPDRPRGRMRYSVAHEIAHTFFPDCAERVRNRLKQEEMAGDEWQLEMLCNIGASEILMPIGSFPALKGESLTVDHLMQLRKQFDVSSEAVFLRVVRLTDQPCAMFVASRQEHDGTAGGYQIDYAIGSHTWGNELPKGIALPDQTVVAECTAIGFTAKRDEEWPGIKSRLRVECAGIPPFPGHRFPRVVGLLTAAAKATSTASQITFLQGDATEPRGKGRRIIAQVVNDKTPNWGAGFARVVRMKWPLVQEEFCGWTTSDPANLSLGKTHLCEIEPNLSMFHMVCQHGYGPSPTPRLRYRALQTGLMKLAEVALATGASVHMPRIGCGEAGGDWEIVSELIGELLCRNGISVIVYNLPGSAGPTPPTQRRLF